MKLGSSGARIVIENDHVLKFDTQRTGTRVREQGIWLANRLSAKHLPRIIEIYPDGYMMERLDQTPLVELVTQRETYCHRLFYALENIWPIRVTLYRVEFDARAHDRYVGQLLRDVGLTRGYRKLLRSYAQVIQWHQLAEGQTHGDAILENLLIRKHDGIKRTDSVLIDPIPACSALPDLRAIDVGRVIQSAIGYERVRYDVEAVDPWDKELIREPIQQILNRWLGVFNLNEARAACYFALIHMLRGVRSAPDGVTAQKLEFLLEDLLREVSRWMR